MKWCEMQVIFSAWRIITLPTLLWMLRSHGLKINHLMCLARKRTKFINRAFAWMYHVAVSDALGALTWLLPSASLDLDADVDELCQRIFLDEQADETLLLGPVLLASFAYAIMISPWYTFRHMKDRPPTDGSGSNSITTDNGQWVMSTKGSLMPSNPFTESSLMLGAWPAYANLAAWCIAWTFRCCLAMHMLRLCLLMMIEYLSFCQVESRDS